MNESLYTTIDAKKISRGQLCCRHTKLIAGESIRMLTCELCGLRIDPFDFLMKLAQRKVVLHWGIEELKRKKKGLLEEIETLKKEKRKVRRNAR
jgi:hypothetical protein